MKVTVKVTAAHIAAANAAKDSIARICSCPVARAIRALGFLEARVDCDSVYLTAGPLADMVTLPNRAQRFISDYDSYRCGSVDSPKPCQFTLSLTPDQWQERTV